MNSDIYPEEALSKSDVGRAFLGLRKVLLLKCSSGRVGFESKEAANESAELFIDVELKPVKCRECKRYHNKLVGAA